MNPEHPDMELEKIDVVALLHGLFKSALRLLLPGVLIIALTAALMGVNTWKGYSPRYRASASFTVKMTNPLYANQQYYNNSAAEQMANTFPYILTSGVLSEQVRQTLGISSMPNVSAEAMGSTNIITLTVTSGDAQLAYDVLHCVMDIYPAVAEFVVGPTQLSLLNDSGLPTSPINTPNYPRSIMLGGLMGGVLWAVIVLLYWLTHQTVNNEDELRSLVNLPCLGRLPIVRGIGRSKYDCPILTEKNDKFGFNESVRLLRIRAEKAMAQEGARVLLVTSTIPNEGKTTVSVNLATAFAHKGKRTLLVDCDLRNPSIGGIFGIENKQGFTDYLHNKCCLSDIIHSMDTEHLHAVFTGDISSSPEKLLASERARTFIEEVRNLYDCIILDTPPCGMLADAAEIGTLADCILLTVRQDFSCRRQILEGVQLLSDAGKPIIGAVLNMAAAQAGGYNYAYNYGYGYGYGYSPTGKSAVKAADPPLPIPPEVSAEVPDTSDPASETEKAVKE